MARFDKCPLCGGLDIEISDIFADVSKPNELEAWGCWDCDWIESLTLEEKDERAKQGKDLGQHHD